MSTKLNHQWIVANHAKGLISDKDYKWVESPVSKLADNEVLVRNLYLSLDPTNRVWMNEKDSYLPAMKIGEVMRGIAIGVVEESTNPAFKTGDLVQGLTGWQTYYKSNGADLAILPAGNGFPVTGYLGLLGHIGLTAHYGLLEIGKPKPGETVVVSAAAGAVGSLAGQIAKIKGCRVVGIAGSDEKCHWLKNELGFDGVINYKSESVAESLQKHCPQGIDVYFDNVGGATLDAVLGLINNFGRVISCGMISSYNDTDPVFTSRNFGNVLIRRVLVKGFICLDHMDRMPAANKDLIQWFSEGRLKYRVDEIKGLENAVKGVNKLFDGSNQGKLIVRVAEQ